MPYTTFFIDLDETVYSSSCGVWEAISRRMEQYMHERLNLSREEIPGLRKSLYQQYGTTLRGLQMTRQIDEREYVDYVHNIPLDQFLAPDPELCEVLMRYSQLKIIFTNADRNHARRVMDRLQIAGCFDGMVDIFDIAPYCKPMPESFQIAMQRAGEQDPARCVFIDDSPQNLAAARAQGFTTVQVGSPKPGYLHPEVTPHYQIPRLSDLPKVLVPGPAGKEG
jgi:pyrimidine 5'-nucleotidase